MTKLNPMTVFFLAFALWCACLVLSFRAGYEYGASTTAPICAGDSLNPSGIHKVPTVWPRGPVAGARP